MNRRLSLSSVLFILQRSTGEYDDLFSTGVITRIFTGALTVVVFFQGLQQRLMVLFPQDVLLLSVDNKRLNIRYEVV